MKPYSLFKSLLYSLTSITAARLGEIVMRASSRSSKNYRTALLVYLLLQITMLAWWALLVTQLAYLSCKVRSIYVFLCIRLLYWNNETPEYLSSKVFNRMDSTPYNLRNTVNKLAVPLPRTEIFKNRFSYSGLVLRNSLPDRLGQASSLTTFKSSIRCHNFPE